MKSALHVKHENNEIKHLTASLLCFTVCYVDRLPVFGKCHLLYDPMSEENKNCMGCEVSRMQHILIELVKQVQLRPHGYDNLDLRF